MNNLCITAIITIMVKSVEINERNSSIGNNTGLDGVKNFTIETIKDAYGPFIQLKEATNV
jgi:hypothetical protein